MTEASVTFAVGSEQVTVVLPVDLPADGETIITGDFGGVIPAGTTARLRGDVNFTGNMHVRGTLLCDPSGVNLNGNGFDIHTHDGTLNLVGIEKTAWCRWGDTPVGWEVGDRLAVAPTAANVYVPTETIWQGSWAATTRPINSPDVILVGGSIARPEVANLSQTVTLRNLQRIMIHEASAPNPQTLKWIRVLDTGEVGVLGMYPIHFHRIGDHARGSLIEGVVVEGGKNHAFVTHGSHGITLRDTVAYKVTNDAYWWDPTAGDPLNNSDDILYDHALALDIRKNPGTADPRLTAFHLGGHQGNRCINSAASCVALGNNTSGFLWPEMSQGVWDFTGNVAHNLTDGIFVWQNNSTLNLIDDYTAYNCKRAGVEHGAYLNNYQFVGLNVTNCKWGLEIHALPANKPGGLMLFENVISDSPLRISHHNRASPYPVIYRACTFPSVVMWEPGDDGGFHRFEDCGLTPTDFTFEVEHLETVIELWEAGILVGRWAAGVWS